MKEKEKTAVDVASQAVEALANGGERLADSLEKVGEVLARTAPGVWRDLVEYHRVLALGEMVFRVFFCLLCMVLSGFAMYVWVKGKKLTKDAASEKEDATHHYKLASNCTAAMEFGVGFRVVAGGVAVIAWIMSVCTASELPGIYARYRVPERAAALEVLQAAGWGR